MRSPEATSALMSLERRARRRADILRSCEEFARRAGWCTRSRISASIRRVYMCLLLLRSVRMSAFRRTSGQQNDLQVADIGPVGPVVMRSPSGVEKLIRVVVG